MRIVLLVLSCEVIAEVRIPYGLVDVVSSYYAQEPKYFAFGKGRHFCSCW